jgi:hypothetical protein
VATPFPHNRAIARLLAIAGLCLPGLALAQSSPTTAQPDGLSSSAEYIAAFVRYVHWEDEDRITAWRICIIGDLPRDQERAYAGREVRGKTFDVRHIGADAPLDGCHVLDMTAADAAATAEVLARTRLHPILAIGAGSPFCSAGGQICLHMDESRQKFEVNLSAMHDAGLGVSARLLSVGPERTATTRGEP